MNRPATKLLECIIYLKEESYGLAKDVPIIIEKKEDSNPNQ